MCKKLSNLLILGLLVLGSCSEGTEPVQEPPTAADGTGNVEFVMSRAAKDDFAAAGVSTFTVFVYHNDRHDTSLYLEQEMNVDMTKMTLELPLGDNFQTFAVANAASITGKEDLSTVDLHLDPTAANPVWLSEVTKFSSDKSVSQVALSLQRLVAEVQFTPAETAAELASQTYFDAMELTFNHTASVYNVATATPTAGSYTLKVDAAGGYCGSFYTFATTALDDDATLEINYLKGGVSVNTSAGELEMTTKFAANNRYKVSVPVLAPDYATRPWSAASRAAGQGLTVTVTPF